MRGASYNRNDTALEKSAYRHKLIEAAVSAGIVPSRIFTLPARYGHDVKMFLETWPEAHFTCIERDVPTALLRDPVLRGDNVSYLVTQVNQFVANGRIDHLVSGPQINGRGESDHSCAHRELAETAPKAIRDAAFEPFDIAFLDYTGHLNATAQRDCIEFARKFMKERFVFAITFSMARCESRGVGRETTIRRSNEIFDAIQSDRGISREPFIDIYTDSTPMIFGLIAN